MVNIPGDKPFVPHIAPKDIQPGKGPDEAPKAPVKSPVPQGTHIGKGPEYDAQGIAVRLAAFATKAREKELKFEEIVRHVIELTGITNPEAAMTEANKRLDREIENTIVAIKSNKDLMEEAEAWQDFAEVLESKLNEEQLEAFFGIIKETIHLMASKNPE
jgi:hypothetical protein